MRLFAKYILLLLIINTCNAGELLLFMGDVSQGNLFAIRQGDEAIIIDCGHYNSQTDDHVITALAGFLKGATTDIVITHQHKDHYS